MVFAATPEPPDGSSPPRSVTRPGLFVRCPHCGLKLFVTPATIPQAGREKRCVRCMDRFRLVLTPDELVVQYQVDARDGPGGRRASTAGREERYALTGGDRAPNSLAEDSAGMFSDLLRAEAASRPAAGDSEDDDLPPIEQRIQVDQVQALLAKNMPGAYREKRPSRLLGAAEVQKRAAPGPRRAFRLATEPAPEARGRRFERLRGLLAGLTILDYALLAALVLVGLGASLGLTDVGIFGVKALRGSDTDDPTAPRPFERATFTQAEVRDLVVAATITGRSDPEPFHGSAKVLPEGDYGHLFVEDVEVTIRSTPAGATVYRGEQALGETPLVIRLQPTGKMVELLVEKKGYDPETVRFVPGGGRSFLLPLRALGDPSTPRARSVATPGQGSRADRAQGPAASRRATGANDFLIY